jgi:hypothetical protein
MLGGKDVLVVVGVSVGTTDLAVSDTEVVEG